MKGIHLNRAAINVPLASVFSGMGRPALAWRGVDYG